MAREAKNQPSSAPECPHQNQNPNQKTTAGTWSAGDLPREGHVTAVDPATGIRVMSQFMSVASIKNLPFSGYFPY
jgi:hypothetical protein